MKDTSRKDAGINKLKSENIGRKGMKFVDVERTEAKSVNTKRKGAESVDTRKNGTKLKDTERKGVKLRDNGINVTGIEAKVGNVQKGVVKVENAKRKCVRNKPEYLNPEEDPRFHDTYKFLRRYRDATYSLKVVVHQMETQFRMNYGTSVDEFLDSIYAAGADLSGADIEERAKSIERSNRMLKMLDSSVDLLRANHKHGEQYYWILYYTFLSPQKPNGTNEIIEKLRPHISNISYRTYYRKRHKAIESLSIILWGYTAKETLNILNEFFQKNEIIR